MIDATPAQLARVGDLVTNIRAFDSLARQIWGGDAALTVEIDGTLVRIDAARLALAKAARRGAATEPIVRKLRARVAVLAKQAATLRKQIPPYNAIGKDALASLALNLQLLRQLSKRL